jgi:hypothetical protein
LGNCQKIDATNIQIRLRYGKATFNFHIVFELIAASAVYQLELLTDSLFGFPFGYFFSKEVASG